MRLAFTYNPVPDVEQALSFYRDTLGWVYRAQGKLPEAATELEKAAAADRNSEILTHLGSVDAAMGDKRRAASSFSEALSIDPNYAPAMEGQRRLKQ